MDLRGEERGVQLLIHDRDTKFTISFDEVFRTEDVRIIKTPIQAPRVKAFAERWVRAGRRE
jgi:putative transposase